MMSKHPDEKISVLMDGELEGTERDRLIQELKMDSQTRCCLERYQLISDALKKHLPDMLGHDLFQRVTQAIAGEEPHRQISLKSSDTTHFTWRVTGFALAASLAALAVIGIQWTQPEQSLVSPQLASTSETGPIVADLATTQQIPANRNSDIQ